MSRWVDIVRGRNTHPNVSFANHDMGSFDIVSESVNIVTASYALRNAPDLGIAIDEISRVHKNLMRRGGLSRFLQSGRKYPREMEYQSLNSMDRTVGRASSPQS